MLYIKIKTSQHVNPEQKYLVSRHGDLSRAFRKTGSGLNDGLSAFAGRGYLRYYIWVKVELADETRLDVCQRLLVLLFYS